MAKIKFKSFSSGSCGNCYYIGIADEETGNIGTGILIDAGVSLRRVKMELEKEGIGIGTVGFMLISHDHWDHIRSIGSYCKKLHLPVMCSATLGKALIRRPGTGEYLRGVMNPISEGWNEIVPGQISVRYFIVPHDATETVGYAILIGGHKYVHITDCGRMTEEAMNLCKQAETVVIESNYDSEMLANGPYPIDLQERIRNGHGHLSNTECAAAMGEFLHDGLKNIFLCHLSEHNNTPELALGATRPVASSYGEGIRLIALPRETASPLFTL